MNPHTATDEAARTERNRYFDGKRLSARDLGAEQRYLIARRRLVDRALFGWGVVHGLEVEAADSEGRQARPGRVMVTPGFALDRHGAEILLPAGYELVLDQAFRF